VGSDPVKLIGSKTEDDLRAQLQASHESLFNDPGRRRLLTALRSKCPELRTAYVLNWTPEQGEDLYCVLVDGAVVVDVELDRMNVDVEPIIATTPLAKYIKGLRGADRIKLAVALDLVRRGRGQ
jgi:hypothetical protein